MVTEAENLARGCPASGAAAGVRGPGPAALTVAPEFFSAGILCSAVQLTRISNEKDKTIKDKKIKELVSL